MSESLVIAPQWIGDAVMTEPLLRRLQARGERLSVAALPWVAPVYRAMPQVSLVLDLPFVHGALQLRTRWQLARSWRGRFDAAYICPNSLKSALLPWWARIGQRVGYAGELRSALLTHCLPKPLGQQRPPMVAFYSALAGAAASEPERPLLQCAQDSVAQALHAHTLERQGYYVFAPGAEYGPAKRWPAAHFAALAALLPLPVVLLGSSKEAQACADIARDALAGGALACINLAGRTPLDQALALIAGSKAMVSNDSGLMHVAAALDVPQLAVFGSSSPLHTPPLSPRARVEWLKNDASYRPALDCAPCFARICPLGHTRCLTDISPQRAWRSLQSAN